MWTVKLLWYVEIQFYLANHNKFKGILSCQTKRYFSSFRNKRMWHCLWVFSVRLWCESRTLNFLSKEFDGIVDMLIQPGPKTVPNMDIDRWQTIELSVKWIFIFNLVFSWNLLKFGTPYYKVYFAGQRCLIFIRSCVSSLVDIEKPYCKVFFIWTAHWLVFYISYNCLSTVQVRIR